MKKDYIPFYYEWIDLIGGLNNEDHGRLMKAIFAFAKGKVQKRKLSREAEMAYQFITSAITRSEIHRKNGQKGGLARAKNMAKKQ